MLDWLRATYNPVTIYTYPSVYCFAHQNCKILVNDSFREFGTIERVTSPARLRATLSIDVQVTLPARFRVNNGVILPAQVTLPTRFRVNMFAAPLGVNDRVISPAQFMAMLPAHFWVNMFAAPLRVNDRVISPAQVQATLPTHYDKVILAICCPAVLPTRFQMKKFAAHSQPNGFTAYSWVNEFVPICWLNKSMVYAHESECAEYYAAVDQEMMACIQVINIAVHASINAYVVQKNEFVAAPAALECKNHFNDVYLNNHAIQRFYGYQGVTKYSMDGHNSLPIYKNFHESVWRNPTAQYDVADHPYFVFHPKQSEFSSFNETLKGYANHLLQYRLICVIEFVVCWSNHLCHFMSQNLIMLVNFDLSPKQYCQRLHLAICRSQFYKHDFAVISSAPGPSTNYVVVSCIKYLEKNIHWILQQKYLYKISTWFSAKEDSKNQINNCFKHPKCNPPSKIGGGQAGVVKQKIKTEVIRPFIINTLQNSSDKKMCEFVEHIEVSRGLKKYKDSNHLLCNVPLHLLTDCLFKNSRISIGHMHDVHIPRKMTKGEITELFKIHDGECEHKYVTIFRPYTPILSCERGLKYREVQNLQINNVSDSKQPGNLEVNTPIHNTFPPAPPNASLRQKIIKDFCDATEPSKFEEAGCTVCGALILQTELSDLSSLNIDLSMLNTSGLGFTRKERKIPMEPISELDGPAIDTSCHCICISCKDKVRHKKMPKVALARGLWLGEVPNELQQLSFTEKLLIGKVRHNRCVVRVAKGMHKMIANAVAFEHPMQKIYTVLPPPIEEMDELLAFIFTGPCQPTTDDFHRIPLLVRRNKVAKALEWLKLNHQDYADLEISYKNLESYPEDTPPVVINYRHSATNKITEATSVHDMELEHGTEKGMCPFTVHTLTSEEYNTMNSETLKAMAAKHLDDDGKVLAIGHSKEPQSIWKNPKLYPQMFPWLFPYGLGGIGHERQRHKLSDAEHKRHLLLYHDKHF